MPGYILYPLECFPADTPAPERIYLDLDEVRGMARPNRAFDFLLREGLLPPGTSPRAFRRRPEARERADAGPSRAVAVGSSVESGGRPAETFGRLEVGVGRPAPSSRRRARKIGAVPEPDSPKSREQADVDLRH